MPVFTQETAGSAWKPPQAEGSPGAESIIPAREEGGADRQEHPQGGFPQNSFVGWAEPRRFHLGLRPHPGPHGLL